MHSQRIHVIGTSGSGKTTLAQTIAQHLQLPHTELDALHWNPNWTPAPAALFRERVAAIVQGDRWVIDGNYSKVRDLIWSRADTLIWLDYPFWLVLKQIVQRSLWRAMLRQELWNGNREDLWRLFSPDSMILWTLKTYHRQRREYPLLFQQPEYSHLTIVRLSSPHAARSWVLSQQSNEG